MADTAPHVLVYGFGAVGILYAYILEKAGVKVTAISRSDCRSIQENGIHIKSKKFGEIKGWAPHRVVSTVQEAVDTKSHFSYILCTFKCLPDVSPTSELLKPILDNSSGSRPTIVLMQNGLGIEKPVQNAFPQHNIVSVAIWIGANVIKTDRKLTLEHGDLEKLELGVYTGDERVKEPASDEALKALKNFIALLNAGGGETNTPSDMQAARWNKSLWNAVFSVFCSLSRLPVSGLVYPDVEGILIPQAKKAMAEVLSVARSLGFGEDVLPSAKIDAVSDLTITSYSGETGPVRFKPSMLMDIDAGRPIELHPILGSIVEHAKNHGIEVPILEFSLAILTCYQKETLRK